MGRSSDTNRVAHLRGGSGPAKEEKLLWTARPSPKGDGLTFVVVNSRSRSNTDHGPSFGACAFAQGRGVTLVATDERGWTYKFDMVGGTYSLLKRLGSRGTAMAASSKREEEVLVGLGSKKVACIDTEAPEQASTLSTLSGHRHDINAVSFHPVTSTAFTCSVDALVLWHTETWQKLRTLGAGSGIVDAAFTPSGEMLLVLFRNKSIVGWDTESFDTKVELKAPEGSPYLRCFGISSDGNLLLSGGYGINVFVWDIRSQTMLRTIEMPATCSEIVRVQFLPDCIHAAILCDDGIVRIVRVSDGPAAVILEVVASRGAILHFALDPVGRYLAACVSDGTLRLYDLDAALAHKRRVAQRKKDMGLLPEEITTDASVLAAHSVFAPPKRSRPKPKEAAAAAELPCKAENENANASANRAVPKKESVPAATQRHHSGPKTVEDLYMKTVGKPVDPPAPFELHTHEAVDTAVRGSSDVDWPPLVRLANDLSDSDVELNSKKLLGLLSHFGSFPAKFRLLVWRFMLRLPQNRNAFAALTINGIHPAWKSVSSEYPIKNQRVLGKLQKLLSALSYWSPVFAQVPYLPGLVFPFVKLYSSDDVAMFETVATVLTNWCGTWFESFPHPPVALLNAIESSLGRHDQELLRHFSDCEVGPKTYAWLMLRTLFSEVLNKDEWLRLWDNFIGNGNRCTVMLSSAVVAYLRYFRAPLLRLRATSDFEAFFRSQNAIDASKWIKMMFKTAGTAQADEFTPLDDDYASEMGNGEPAGLANALPRGEAYPAFNRYPKAEVDYREQERVKVAAAEEELLTERQRVEALRLRTRQLEKEENEWKATQEKLLEEELERQRVAKIAFERRLAERQRLEVEARKLRLDEIARMEEIAAQSLELQKKMRHAEMMRIVGDIEQRKAEEEAKLQAAKDAEEIKKLEFEAKQRIIVMQEARMREQEAAALRTEMMTREKQRVLEEKIREEQWKLEDDERAMRQKEAAEKNAEVLRANDAISARRELEAKLALKDLEDDHHRMAIERERRLRHVAEDELIRSQERIKERRAQESIVSQEEERERRMLVESKTQWAIRNAKIRDQIIAREQRRVALETEMREQRIKELERIQRRRAFEESVLKSQRGERVKTLEEEKSMQKILLSLDDQRRSDRKMEMELLFREQELKERAAYVRSLREAEEKAIADEREKFNTIRADIRSQQELQESDLVRSHEETMARTIIERERKLVEHAMRKKREAQEDEATKIARDLEETTKKLSEAEAELERAAASETAGDSILSFGEADTSSASAEETAEELAKRAMEMIRRHEARQEELAAGLSDQ